MTQELKENYGHIFEEELLKEINQVAVFKKISEGAKLVKSLSTAII